MTQPRRVSAQVRELANLIARQDRFVTREEALVLAVARWPFARTRLPKLLEAALQAGLLDVDERGRLGHAPTARRDQQSGVKAVPPADHHVRAVVVDVESVVRLTIEEPGRDARIYQIGAVRLSADAEWQDKAEPFNAYVELPDGWADRLRSAAVRRVHQDRARPAKEVLGQLRAYCEDAEVLVAYNGTEADFQLLDQAFAHVGVPELGWLRLVDSFYLALALWPFAPSHRLAELVRHLELAADDLSWHDAADDAQLTALLMREGALVFASWPAERRALLRAVTRGSAAWELLIGLAEPLEDLHEAAKATDKRQARRFDDAEVARVLEDAFGDRPPRRARVVSHDAFRLPAAILDPHGRVSAARLARVGLAERVEERPAQERMTELLRDLLDDRDALVEAPTGTGKSLAILAVALEWLARSPDNRVIVATQTKQLQAQLAKDVEQLGPKLPGLLPMADLVKGKANRLSLRALVAALADATAEDGHGRRVRVRQRSRFVEQAGFRELLAYLTLRLLAAETATHDWAARSVDPIDLPLFLTTYLGAVVHPQLTSLSQESGDFSPDSEPLAARTDDVAEAIDLHRLVLANHALLLANREDLAVLGPQTLLVVDEAHTLESTATDAITHKIDYRDLEHLVSEAQAWAVEHGGSDATVAVAASELANFLDSERLVRTAMRGLDVLAGAPTVEAGRVATLVSPYSGANGEIQARDLLGTVRNGLVYVGKLATALWRFIGSDDFRQLRWFDAERTRMLATRAKAAETAMAGIYDDAAPLLGLPQRGAAPGAAGATSDSSSATVGDQEQEESAAADPPLGRSPSEPFPDDPDMTHEGDAIDPDEEDLGEADEPADTTGDGRVAIPARPNRVILLAEEADQQLRGDNRRFRFHIASAPIDLGREPDWQAFVGMFARAFYVSATLRVASDGGGEGWGFIRNRLALDDTVVAHVLPGPFDLAEQARLICLADFPSWSEQPAGAVRTVAHQLTGYATAVMHRPEPTDEAPWPAFENGALVLTTARRSARAIAKQLEANLIPAGLEVPVHAASLLGNTRAIAEFADTGGFCVGTKGLWQGVDIAQPSRLRLVWINKLPFAPFKDPVIAARRAAVAARADDGGAEDPDLVASETYYLPLAAMELRQAVGRLIRTHAHRGIIVVSDRKLAGTSRQRRVYRRILLESLDPGLLVADPDTGERAGGNVLPMTEGWTRIWSFLAEVGVLDRSAADSLAAPEALIQHTLLPETRAVRAQELSPAELATLQASGPDVLAAELVTRAERVATLLNPSGLPVALKDEQRRAIDAVARGMDLLAVLPTGFGKSYTFQLPALVLPGVTLVVSPLVALMADQALELNRTIGGAVRALIAPLAESNSRRGKTEVGEQLGGRVDHGIKIVYLSPERLCQRRVQELVRAGVANGIVRRIAIDEAHTFVQWGDDFRPSFRRLERFLSDLRGEFGLPLTAVTATATRSVLEGLRGGLFGLAPNPDDGRPDGPRPDPATFRFVTANPLRPELAIYRRTISPGGPLAVAGLVERVVDALQDHAIMYCLTIREVEATHAALRDYLGDAATARLRRFHGRLSETEKAAVSLEFREAPRRGDDGFVPMVVVATAAFGLGVDRSDVRCVLVASPPTDLAALYQQLGRAGRDQAGRTGDDITATSTGIALATPRGYRTVRFMAGLGLPTSTLARIGQRLLDLARSSPHPVLDASVVADELLAADLADGRLSPAQAARPFTIESYRTGVMGALAALAADGAIEDHGDFPIAVAVGSGELSCDNPDLQPVIGRLAAVPPGRLRALDIAQLHADLAAVIPDYRDLAEDPAATWNLLAEMHDLGWLDISQAPCRGRTRTALAPTGATHLPTGFTERAQARARRGQAELAQLQAFFNDTRCINQAFRDYFTVPSLPSGTCGTPTCRCSACWGRTGVAGEALPALLRAALTPNPRPAATADAPHRRERLDGNVRRLLWDNRRGLTPSMITLVLKGEETFFSVKHGRRMQLWPRLLHHRVRGAHPGVRPEDVLASLRRLRDIGMAISTDGRRWRLAAYIEQERRRADQQATTAAAPRRKERP